MPTYQYRCTHCGYDFEEFQSITEPPLSKCPKCGQKPRRLITGGAGFLLKGSGFYTTDYRSESYKAAARKDGEVPTPSVKPGGGSSSDKPSGKTSS